MERSSASCHCMIGQPEHHHSHHELAVWKGDVCVMCDVTHACARGMTQKFGSEFQGGGGGRLRIIVITSWA